MNEYFNTNRKIRKLLYFGIYEKTKDSVSWRLADERLSINKVSLIDNGTYTLDLDVYGNSDCLYCGQLGDIEGRLQRAFGEQPLAQDIKDEIG